MRSRPRIEPIPRSWVVLTALAVGLLAGSLGAQDAPPPNFAGPGPDAPPPPREIEVRTGFAGARAVLLPADALRSVAGGWVGLLDPAGILARDGLAADPAGAVRLPLPDRANPLPDRFVLLVGGEGRAPRILGPRPFVPHDEVIVRLLPAGRLTGRVTDADGKPVPEARIRVLEEAPGNRLSEKRPALLGFDARSDEKGAFATEGLPAGPFVVLVEAGEAGTLVVENVWSGDGPLELGLPAPAAVGGTVRIEPKGDPLPGAEVWLIPLPTSRHREVRRAVTDEKGRWRIGGLPEIGYRMEVRSKGHLHLAPREVVPRAGEDRTGLDVVLRLLGGLRGRVVTVATDPVPGARIYLEYPLVEGDYAVPDPHRAVATTNEKGEFLVEGLPPEGRLRVAIVADGFASVIIEDVSLAGGEPRPIEPVILPAGLPVSGRVVASESEETGLRGVIVVAVPVDEDARAILETGRSWRARAAATDADGEFRIVGLAPGAYRLAASRDDRLPAIGDAFELKVGAEAETGRTLTLAAGRRIVGTVRDGDDRPVSTATIHAVPHAGGPDSASGRTAGDGTFVLAGVAAGLYDLEASAPGFAPARVERVTPGRPVRLVLDRPGGIAGRVRPAEGEDAVPAFSLAALRFESVPEELDDRLEPVWFGRFRSEDGAFRVEGLPAGRYRLELELAGGRTGFVEGVRVVAGEITKDVEIGTVAAGTLVGRVVDRLAGGAVEGAVVGALSPGADVARSTALTDADGEYRLEGVPPGPVVLLVEARGRAPVRRAGLRVEAGLRQRVDDVVLGAGAALRVTAKGSTGEPLVGARFTLESLDTPGRRTVASDGEGVALFDLLTPGPYRLWRRGEDGVLSSWVVRLETGALTDLGVDLSAGAVLEGKLTRAAEPVPGACVEVFRVESGIDPRLARRVHRTATSDDGTFLFGSLPPGSYLLRVRAPDPAAALLVVPLTVPKAERVRRDVELPREGLLIRVEDRESGDPIDGAEVVVRPAGRVAERSLVEGLGRIVARSRTRPGGLLAVPGLAPGRYRVETFHAGYGQEVTDVEVAPRVDVVEVRVRMAAAGLVTGEVLDLRQRPVPGAFVVVRDARGRPVTRRDRIRADSDGRFRIEGLGTGRYRVYAEAPGHARDTRWRIDVFPGGEAKLRFRLEEEGRLRVTVFGPGGVPLRGAEVEIRDAFDHHVWPPREEPDLYRVYGASWLTDAAGQVLVANLPAGVHVVHARFRGLKPFSTRVLVATGVENRAAVVLLED